MIDPRYVTQEDIAGLLGQPVPDPDQPLPDDFVGQIPHGLYGRPPVCRDPQCRCSKHSCRCHDEEQHQDQPDGLCGDPRCRCDDPVCWCHEGQDHEGHPDSVGMDYRTWPGGVNTPVDTEPDHGTVTVTEGYAEDLAAWPGGGGGGAGKVHHLPPIRW
jgi:hypothetical protein